ncbi:DUF4132 domain-containing protein [Bariatricus sp. SGI.154]|uniref:DUF4132 domain-containing protein n=1 Tax=Bariatricus sp. SGI.154 TaxID=3420549 RepID=UPI003CFC7B75
MNKETLNINQDKWKEVQKNAKRRALTDGGLADALCNLAANYYGGNAFQSVWQILMRIYGKAPNQVKTIEEFWASSLKNAVIFLVGKDRQADMEAMSQIRLECQFSDSMWRRSYRTQDVGYHAVNLIYSVCHWIYWTFYEKSVKEMLFYQHDWIRGYDMYLALEIRNGNLDIIDLMKEAMYGDNQEILLSRVMIVAIVISGNEELIDLLLRLLVAARLQEGLRQQILESADAGSTETLIKFLKVCIEEDFFRYSSTIRAFDTWTGLGYGDAKPAVVKKCAALAYECLTDRQTRERYLNSANNQEAYFALWSTGCYDIEKTDWMACRLLEDEKKYRRILGWLFVSRTDSSSYQMKMAERYIEEREEEILAWVTSNLSVTQKLMSSYTYSRDKWECLPVENSNLPSDARERQKLFYQLKSVAEFIGGKSKTFTGNPFEFTSITLENTRVISCMMSLAGYDMNQLLVDELAALRQHMNTNQRQAFYTNFLAPGKNFKHREYLRSALEDKSIYVKELAVKRLAKCNLLDEDMEVLADSLRSKSSSLRKGVILILQAQSPSKLNPLIGKMLASDEEYQIQAGIELLLSLKKEHPEIQNAQEAQLAKLYDSKLSTQTSILLEQLRYQTKHLEESYTEENGFGLYDPQVAVTQITRSNIQEVPAQKPGLLTRLFGKRNEKASIYSEKELKQTFPSQAEFEDLIDRMNAVFVRHADYEYEVINWDSSKTKILFGDSNNSTIRIPAKFGRFHFSAERGALKLEMIPFYQEFIEAAGVYATDIEKLMGMRYVTYRWRGDNMYGLEYLPWFEAFLKRGLTVNYNPAGYEKYKGRYWQINDILKLLLQLFDPHECFTLAMKFYRSMLQVLGEENLGKSYVTKKDDRTVFYHNYNQYPVNHKVIAFWRQMMRESATQEKDFEEWFLEEHWLERQLTDHIVITGPDMGDYFRAVDIQLIPKDALYKKLLLGNNAATNIRMLTNPTRWQQGRIIYETYPWAKDFVNQIVLRIVEVEEKRGELPTALTPVAQAIERFEGAEYFCHLLAALGKENFFRGYEYSSNTTKKAVLSRLLKRCYPSKNDTPDKLKQYLAQTDIKEKRLAEAVMYAPQWAGFAEEILGWPGLKCAVWFFHAHINETFSAEKETETAIYSPISPQQFNDGAFDKNWFFNAYNKLGEKHFMILYKSAKYITAGSNQHRRSQLYADAVLGHLDADTLKAEIIAKRNQEKLRCYPLIPIPEDHTDEALHRYEFIQKFLKESKQFGAQRRASEKKACDTALENLAITTGFMDVNRMTWYLESEKLEEIRPLMEPQELDGVRIWLEIDEDGTAKLAIEKNGKRQKTLPKTLNKNETVLTLKDTIKELKEQKRRAKESLERAMVESTDFSLRELDKISDNPVLFPMLNALVWTNGAINGFLEKENEKLVLKDLQGKKQLLHCEEPLRAAHPYDLMKAGEWAEFMHFFYEHKIVQPFKQVFREYYPMIDDERQEKNISRRYAGHQVQPQKTVALLKGRGWTVDYEEGLQKVYYKENLIVRMYALADWFSPADIEAPTLETIRFFDRNTEDIVNLEEIPPILFSEAMRDMDLVVSVAHVGGVDPEASHSTVEMRTAIAAELVKLLKLTNVSFIGSHAKIQGSLNNYSVHMGSGIVHGEGIGMIAILPIHSQARGRIFLPFADEDPKTAEIMSKIILLSEDKKIKDPSILNQIRD